MKSKNINKEQWVAIFQETGLDETMMINWHRVFEKKNPQGHQEFLEWLNLSLDEVAEIRSL